MENNKLSRIDSERELIDFIQKLKLANIDIPENVTLEIDSTYLQEHINTLGQNLLQFSFTGNIDRCKYMGEKISFKSEQTMINDKQPHGFCETPHENCTMNYCDENGCINRKRNLVGEPIKMDNNKQMSVIDMLKQDLDIEIKAGTKMIVNWDGYKAMHKEEIIKAFDEGQEYEYQYHINSAPKFDSETYYNETFNNQ